MLRRALGAFPRLVTQEMPRLTSGVAREAAVTAAHLLTYPLGLFAEPARRAIDRHDLHGLSPQQRGLVHVDLEAAGRPILLVHGIVDNHSIFSTMDRALRRHGFSDLSSFDYGLLTTDLRRTADDLAAAIEELTRRSGYDRIHVIGHSLGGLMARYYVQRRGGDERVHTLVTLGTPHQGTVLARAGQVVPLVRQLTPESEVIAELRLPAPACRTRFIAFYSDLDQLVVPSRNGRIDHLDLTAQNIAVSGLGHLSLPTSRRIAFQIAELLRELDPAGAAAP